MENDGRLARDKAAKIGAWGYLTILPRIDGKIPLRKREPKPNIPEASRINLPIQEAQVSPAKWTRRGNNQRPW